MLGIVRERHEPGPAQTRCVGGYQDQPDGAGAARRGIAGDNHEVVGNPGVGDEQLGSVDDDLVGFDDRGGGQGVGRRPCPVLVVRHRDDAITNKHGVEQSGPLTVVPDPVDQQRCLHRRVERRRHQGATGLLVEHRQVEQVTATAAHRLGERQADPSKLRHPPPQVGVVPLLVGGTQPPDQLRWVGTLQEGACRRAQRLLLVGQRQVRHRGSPWPRWAMMSRWISLVPPPKRR